MQSSGSWKATRALTSRRAVRLVLATSVLAVGLHAGFGVVLADDAGVREFFSSQAQPRPQPQPQPQFAPISSYRPREIVRARFPGSSRAPALARRLSRERLAVRPRATFVALPAVADRVRPKARKTSAEDPAATERKITPRQSDTASGADPVASVMRDPTLRAGDIVVLPDGPKVFKGRSGPPFHARDFEDVRHSRAVSKQVQRQLLAMTGHVGRPADEIRELATLPRSETAPDETATEQQAAAVRVVYPGWR